MRARAAAIVAVLLLLGSAIWIVARRERPPAAARPRTASAAQARDVLLVTIDTLRADAVGAYGNAAARTPALDRLAAAGALFDRAFAAAPITLTSHATIMTGLYPPGHGARHNGVPMKSGVQTIAERLHDAGVRTAAFVSAFPLDRSFGLARGFESYSDRMPRASNGRPANERPGRETVDEAIRWIEANQDGRFFAWVHLFEPHAPYGDAGDGRAAPIRYADEVAAADRQLGRLLDALRNTARTTLVIVAGDHGEAFGEHGEVAHSIFVYDTTLHVPLVLAGPGIPAGARVPAPVTLADLAPTIAPLAGVEAWDADGADLRPLLAGGARERPLYAESFAPLLDFGWSSLRSVRSGRWKYIAAPRPELYDVGSDPGETRNVASEHAAVAARLAGRVNSVSAAELPGGIGAVDAESRRRLQALGYLSGSRADMTGARRDPKDARALAAEIALVTSGELRGRGLERALVSIRRQDPGNPQALLRLGYLRLDQGRCGEAERLFIGAIEGGIAGSDAHLGLAMCQGRRGAVADALRSLEHARAREPGNAVVLANIGIAQGELHDDAEAIASLRAALAIDPDLHEARFNLARAHARAGDRAAAAREARDLLARLPAGAPQRAEIERLLRAVE